jgi:hypothetical protein
VRLVEGGSRPTTSIFSCNGTLVDDDYVYDNRQIGLRTSVTAAELRRAVHAVHAQLANLDGVRPFVTERALQQLKFAELLPPEAGAPDHGGAAV